MTLNKLKSPLFTTILGYAVLAVVFTWPLALHLGRAYPSPLMWRGGDPNILIWFIDWVAGAMSGTTTVSPGRMLYFPQGVNPMGGYDGLLIGFLGGIASLVVGSPLIAYNLIVLGSFVASATATYLLARKMTPSLLAARIAGFIFGFSPYMMVRAVQHLNLALTFVIPLTALALIAFLERPDRRRTYLLAGSVLLTALCSLYYALFCVMFIGLAFILHRRMLWQHKMSTLAAILFVGFAAFAPSLPILVSKVEESRLAPFEFVSLFGAEPLNLIFPHPLTNVYGDMTRIVYGPFHGNVEGSPNVTESTSYLGFLMIALLALSITHRPVRTSPHAPLWFASLAVFGVLSFGIEIRAGGLHIAMPYAAFWNMFPFSMIRAPDRFFIIALLAATMLATMVLATIDAKVKKPFWRYVVFGLIMLTFVTERMILPYPLYEVTVSQFYRDVAKEQGDFALVDLPITYPGTSEFNYLQTIHKKPIVDGEFFYSAYTGDTFSFISGNEFLRSSVCADQRLAAPPIPNMRVSLERLRQADIRYVVVHNVMLANEQQCPWLKGFLTRAFAGIEPYFTDGDITVYRL